MTWLSWFLVLFLPLTAQAASHTLAWTYTPQPGEQGFTVQRCTNQPSGCVMQSLATVSLETRRYVDRQVHPRRAYCYQVVTSTAHSNVVCTP